MRHVSVRARRALCAKLFVPVSKLLLLAVIVVASALAPALAFATAAPYTAADCVGCHGAGGSPGGADFAAASPVNRSTACRKCHWEPAGSHPFHNASWDCGSCHVGMGQIDRKAIPTVSTANGWFNTAGSAVADANTLHVIHGNGTAIGGFTKNGRQCGSCHKAASCDACHEDIDPTHADHTWDQDLGDYLPGLGPAARSLGFGTSVGNEYERNMNTALTCSNSTCHVSITGADSPFLVENFSPAMKFTGTWTRTSMTGYTGSSFSRSNYAGAKVDVGFTGQRVELISEKHPYYGMAKVSIDGSLTAVVDLYAAAPAKQAFVFSSEALPSGNHTITIEVPAPRTKNPASRDYSVVVDAVRVWPKVGTSRTPCGACHETVHAGQHANTTPSCGGTGCHNETDLVPIHQPAGCPCHRSTDPKVTAAMTAHDKTCTACHNAMAIHGPVHNASATFEGEVGVPAWGGEGVVTMSSVTLRCLSCHRTNLLADHGSDYSNCSICHAEGGPRSSFTTWDKNCKTGACHPYEGLVPHPPPTRAMNHELMSQGVQPDGMCQSCHGNPQGWQCGAPFGCHTNVVGPVTSVDFTPPSTTATRTGADPIVWRLLPADAGDGVTATYYSFDGAPFAPYGPAEASSGITNPADVSPPYAHTLRYYSVDAANNTETVQTADYNVTDNTPPVISFKPAIEGAGLVSTSAALYVSDPKVNGLNTGVAYVYTQVSTYKTHWGWFPYQMFYQPMASFSYPLDGTWDSTRTIAPLEDYARAVNSAGFWETFGDGGGGSGWFEIQYYARDYTGNQSAMGYAKFYVDLGAPVTTTSTVSAYRWRLNATDNIAGVGSTYYRVDGAPFGVYTAADGTTGVGGGASGAHTLQYYSVDKVGNTEATKTMDYTVP